MPKSLKCKIKHLCYNGTLTERERDRILKALEQEPCEDCISREEIKEFVNAQLTDNEEWASSATYEGRWSEEKKYLYGVEILEGLSEYINDLPSVTPQRAKGYWIEVNDGRCVHHFECSECGQCVSWIGKEEHYCSNCGAYMGGGEE